MSLCAHTHTPGASTHTRRPHTHSQHWRCELDPQSPVDPSGVESSPVGAWGCQQRRSYSQRSGPAASDGTPRGKVSTRSCLFYTLKLCQRKGSLITLLLFNCYCVRRETSINYNYFPQTSLSLLVLCLKFCCRCGHDFLHNLWTSLWKNDPILCSQGCNEKRFSRSFSPACKCFILRLCQVFLLPDTSKHTALYSMLFTRNKRSKSCSNCFSHHSCSTMCEHKHTFVSYFFSLLIVPWFAVNDGFEWENRMQGCCCSQQITRCGGIPVQ